MNNHPKSMKGAAFLAAALMLLAVLLVPVQAAAEAYRPEGAVPGVSPGENTRKQPPLDYDFSYIRVLITIGSTNTIGLDLNGSYTIDGVSGTFTGTEGSPYRLSVTKSGSSVEIKNRTTGTVLASGAKLKLKRTVENYEAGWVTLASCACSDTEGRMYFGDFTFDLDSGSLRVVNRVPMAYYIFGVVGYELNPYCEDEALRAQAVACKNFGLYYIDTDPDSNWDVKDGYSSSQYQAYRGYKANRLSTMRHCLEVLGVAMAYNGGFVPICYGHTNGGETSLPSFIFGSSCQWYDGAYGIVKDDIEFNEYTEDTDTITVTFGGTGNNSRFRDFILKKINTIYGVSATSLKSITELYTFDPLPGTERHMQKLHVKAKVATSSGDKTYTFECPTSHLRTFALTDVDGSGDNYSSSKYCFTTKRLIYWGKTTSNGYKLIYSGHGHGIGLSQIGANIRANPDTYAWNYRQILQLYFPGMTFIRINESAPGEAPPPGPIEPITGYDVVAYGIVTANNINFREGPGSNYTVIGQAMRNEHIDIIDVTSDGWFHAVWQGHEGYITMNYSRVTSFPSPTNGVFMLMDGVTNNAANLRSEPLIRDGNEVTRLPGGTHVTAWAHINKWYYVTTEDGYEGFLSNLTTTYSAPYEYTGCVSLNPQHFTSPTRLTTEAPILPSPGASRRLPE